MKSPETKLEQWSDTALPDLLSEQAQSEEALEAASGEADEHATGRMLETQPIERQPIEEWRPSLWDSLVGYWGSEPEARPGLAVRLFDEEDFSSEHGYEPGFEGRSEFEHGEFERWI